MRLVTIYQKKLMFKSQKMFQVRESLMICKKRKSTKLQDFKNL